MAISMSGATVDSSERTSLLGKTVDTSVNVRGEVEVNGINVKYPHIENYAAGAALAGITSTFATNVTGKIDTYISTVESYVDSIINAVHSSALKGTQLSTALQNFIFGVTLVAKEYVVRLHNAENQIINSVSTAYTTQDTDLSENLKTDTGTAMENIDWSQYEGAITMHNTVRPDSGRGSASRADVPRPGGAMEK